MTLTMAAKTSLNHQRAKKVVSDSPGLGDFATGLVIFVLNLPDRLACLLACLLISSELELH